MVPFTCTLNFEFFCNRTQKIICLSHFLRTSYLLIIKNRILKFGQNVSLLTSAEANTSSTVRFPMWSANMSGIIFLGNCRAKPVYSVL